MDLKMQMDTDMFGVQAKEDYDVKEVQQQQKKQ